MLTEQDKTYLQHVLVPTFGIARYLDTPHLNNERVDADAQAIFALSTIASHVYTLWHHVDHDFEQFRAMLSKPEGIIYPFLEFLGEFGKQGPQISGGWALGDFRPGARLVVCDHLDLSSSNPIRAAKIERGYKFREGGHKYIRVHKVSDTWELDIKSGSFSDPTATKDFLEKVSIGELPLKRNVPFPQNLPNHHTATFYYPTISS